MRTAWDKINRTSCDSARSAWIRTYVYVHPYVRQTNARVYANLLQQRCSILVDTLCEDVTKIVNAEPVGSRGDMQGKA